MAADPPPLPARSVRRVRGLLLLLFVAIATPSAVLVHTTWQQLRFEALHQTRSQALSLGERIDTRLQSLVDIEERRAATDYSYTRVGGALDAHSNLVERSPLAAFPVQSDWPGLLGWFQVDAGGRFSTPLLPAEDGIPVEAVQWASRTALAAQLRDILSQNGLVEADPDPQASSAAALVAVSSPATPNQFEALSNRQQALGNAVVRVDELKIGQDMQNELVQQESQKATGQPVATPLPDHGSPTFADPQTRGLRKEQSVELKDLSLGDGDRQAPLASVRAGALGMFETEVEPFRFTLLGDGHALLFRTVWRDQQRRVQGALFAQQELLESTVLAPHRQSTLSAATDLLIVWNEQVVAIDGGGDAGTIAAQRRKAATLSGELLHTQRLSPPLDGLTLLWHLRQLPSAPGATLLGWTSAVLACILLGAFVLLYRLALRQLRLVRQRQDFVAAVSHELNTPLTSIRMYAEMLKAGWASPAQRQTYYAFILGESERLSRLIANVLQLSRTERPAQQRELAPHSLAVLLDLLRSRLTAQVESAGFTMEWALPAADTAAGVQLAADSDALLQVFINIVDNAIKFAADSEPRVIRFGADLDPRAVRLSVRDRGPGVPAGHQRMVFDLFWRGATPTSRHAPGTGIGLAVVRQLIRAHGGEVEFRNANPGAEITVRLPLLHTAESR